MSSGKSAGRNVYSGNNLEFDSEKRYFRGKPFLLVETHIRLELQHEILTEVKHLKMLDGDGFFRECQVGDGKRCFEILRGDAKDHAASLQTEKIFHPADHDEQHEDQQAGVDGSPVEAAPDGHAHAGDDKDCRRG